MTILIILGIFTCAILSKEYNENGDKNRQCQLLNVGKGLESQFDRSSVICNGSIANNWQSKKNADYTLESDNNKDFFYIDSPNISIVSIIKVIEGYELICRRSAQKRASFFI